MKLTTLLTLATFVLSGFSAPLGLKRQSGVPDAATITRLAPDLGFTAGLNPTGSGDCDGAVNGADGKPIKVPCSCPPAPDVYIPALIKNVQAGFAVNNPSVKVSFPTGDSKQDKSGRISAASITIQNLNGPGKGCPFASTKLGALQKAIDAGTDVTTPANPPANSTSPVNSTPISTPPVKSTSVSTPPATNTPVSTPPANNTPSNGTPDAATITQFAPPLGFKSGVNPTGTGDCDGAVNGTDGKPIKIPCSCPPAQDVYTSQLIANVQAGKALNNPSVSVSFPTGDSKADKSARLTAASITLQNLNGPGKGCPVVSTTFPLQQKAIDAGTDVSPNANNTLPSNTPSNNNSPVNNTPVSTPPVKNTPISTSLVKSTPASPPPTSTPASTPPANNTPSNGTLDAGTITRLAPPLGFNSGVNPTGTGDCDGAVNGADGKPIKIPCSCPPAQDVYISQLIANVQAGKALNNPTVSVSFPTGDSKADKSARLNAASITLQNLNGPGKGCPVVSTTFPLQQKAIDAGTDVSGTPSNVLAQNQPTPTPTPSTPTGVTGNNSGGLDAATIKRLAPELGFQSGLNPTGSGDCDGAVNGSDGRPIKVPCSCPPSKDVYLDALVKNVQAGLAINNPTVKVGYPGDDSKQSQSARINAALITLQNLNGPGKGCPAASTTLVAQQKALSV